MDSLAQEPTVGDIEMALQNLPIGLDETYEQAMRRVETQGGKRERLAKKVLSWVVYSKRILSTTELQHAVAVQSGKPDLDGTFVPSVEIIGSICAGLINIDTQSDVVRVVHYTTQDYLERTSEDWFLEAGTYITMTCVTYLSFERFESGFCQTDEEFEERLHINPFYDYAARNWGHHALTASLEIQQSILDFLRSEAKVSASAQALIASRYYVHNSGYSRSAPSRLIGVHLAAYFGLTGMIMALLENRDHLNVKDGSGRTPLSWAAENGHKAVVELLIEKGAEIESKDDVFGQTSLSLAVKNRHEAVVKLLIEKGAELEAKDYGDQTPLLLAAKRGSEAVVKLLIEKGAEIESKDTEYGQTAISWAGIFGHKAVLKLLLEIGAEFESKYNSDVTSLSWAAAMGHEAMVKLLLEEGAELESKDNSGRTSLSWAAEYGLEAVVKLLLEKGADVGSRDTSGKTPLDWAKERGHEVVVKLLTPCT